MRVPTFAAAVVLSLSSHVVVCATTACGLIDDDDDDGNDDDDDDDECGDGRATGREDCDGEDLDGETCESVGFGEGALACLATCKDFDRSACEAPLTCGDGVIQDPELCDGGDLGGATCEDVGLGSGTLRCTANCGNLDVAGCGPPDGCVPDCGGAICGVDPVCGTSCGACGDGFVCADGQCDVEPRCEESTDACEGDEGCVLVLDVPLVDVDLTVRYDGALVPDPFDGFNEAGAIFRARGTGAAYSFSFSGGDFPVRLRVPAGTYDVDTVLNDSGVFLGAPTSSIRAATGVVLEDGGSLDLDVPLVDLDLTVRYDGTLIPDPFDGFNEAGAVFHDASTGYTYSFSFSGGDFPVTLRVPAGTYDVDTLLNDSGVFPGAPTSVIRAADAVHIDDDGPLDVDVGLVDVDLTVRYDGTLIPDPFDGFNEAGALFHDAVTGYTYSFSFSGGEFPVTLRVPAGTYDIDTLLNDSGVIVGAPTSAIRARSAVNIDDDGPLAIDVPLVNVDLTLSYDGELIPDPFDGFNEAGALFRDASTGYTYSFSFTGGDFPVTLRVPAGAYDVDTLLNDSGVIVGAPTSAIRAVSGVEVSDDGPLDLDVPLFDVAATVRYDGVIVPDPFEGFNEAGTLFHDANTGYTYSFSFSGGAFPVSLRVPAGTYDVDTLLNDSGVFPGAPTSAIRAAGGVDVSDDGPLDLDVSLVDVDVTVRYDGVLVPDPFDGFNELGALFRDAITGYTYSFSFSGGDFPVSLRLPTGVYDVDTVLNDSGVVPGAPTAAIRAAECQSLHE